MARQSRQERKREAARLRKALRIDRDHSQLVIDFGQADRAELGLCARLPEARHSLARYFRTFDGYRMEPGSLRVMLASDTDESDLAEAIGRGIHALATIATRPLTPALVAKVLGVSRQERARWTRDGRLPPSGNTIIKTGHKVAVPTFAVAVVDRLISYPEIIAKWRAMDLGSGANARGTW